MDSTIHVHSLGDAVCISLHANALVKCMNPSLAPPPSNGSIVGQNGLFNLVTVMGQGEGKLRIQTDFTPLKIDFLSNFIHGIRVGLIMYVID